MFPQKLLQFILQGNLVREFGLRFGLRSFSLRNVDMVVEKSVKNLLLILYGFNLAHLLLYFVWMLEV